MPRKNIGYPLLGTLASKTRRCQHNRINSPTPAGPESLAGYAEWRFFPTQAITCCQRCRTWYNVSLYEPGCQQEARHHFIGHQFTWLERARRKEKVCFQYDSYATPAYLYYPASRFGKPLQVDFEGIILAITGNIYLETYGGFLRYFAESVQMRFADFPLARCLKVYISG